MRNPDTHELALSTIPEPLTPPAQEALRPDETVHALRIILRNLIAQSMSTMPGDNRFANLRTADMFITETIHQRLIMAGYSDRTPLSPQRNLNNYSRWHELIGHTTSPSGTPYVDIYGENSIVLQLVRMLKAIAKPYLKADPSQADTPSSSSSPLRLIRT